MARTNSGGSGKQRVSVLGGRYSAQSTVNPSGIPQGTPGGVMRGAIPRAAGRRPGLQLRLGDEKYIWTLVLIEVLLMCWARRYFRRDHGG